MEQENLALKAIQKKLVGKKLSYKEIYAIMDEIANDKLGKVLTTYFVASGYSKGFSDEEIYFLTKAMVETGEKLEFKGIVADKHSVGGVPGTRATLIVVPIIAAAGYTIPKSSSRAITTPCGTADAMEVFANVTFSKEEIYHIVEEVGGCIVWGGSFKIAPADDEIIKIEEPLRFESFDKVLVSVMAKKVAFGSNHIVIHLPYGKNAKLHTEEEAKILEHKFKFLAKKFDVNLECFIQKSEGPAGTGIGPLLEARDSLMVLEQHEDRPILLEEMALELAGQILELCLASSSKENQKTIRDHYKDNTKDWARDLLVSGDAHRKFLEIVKIQGGDNTVTSEELKHAQYKAIIKTDESGIVSQVVNTNITTLARILGCPQDKKSGMTIYKRDGDIVKKGEALATFYSETKHRLDEAIDSYNMFPIYKFKDS